MWQMRIIIEFLLERLPLLIIAPLVIGPAIWLAVRARRSPERKASSPTPWERSALIAVVLVAGGGLAVLLLLLVFLV